MTVAQATIFAAVIGGLALVLGTVIKHRHDQGVTTRASRSSAYSAAFEFADRCLRYADRAKAPVQEEASWAPAHRDSNEWWRIASPVREHGSDAAIECLTKLADTMQYVRNVKSDAESWLEMSKSAMAMDEDLIRGRQASIDKLIEARDQLRVAANEFIHQARRDLGVASRRGRA